MDKNSLIDIMKSKCKILSEKKSESEEGIKNFKKNAILGGTGIFLLLCLSRTVASLVVPIEVVETVYGSKYNLREIFITAYNTTVVFVVAPLILGINTFKLKCSKKERNGYEMAINYLENAIVEEEKLGNNKKVEIDCKSTLRELDKKIRFKYEFGYNQDKYYNFYQKDILEYKLENIYSKEELKEIRNYLVEMEEVKEKKLIRK